MSKIKPDLVVIDGDSVAFKCAAANEERSIKVTFKKNKKTKKFKNRTEFKAWLDTQEKKWALEDFEVEDIQTPGKLSNTLHSVKMMIKGICNKLDCQNYIVVLSGKDNFRDNIPLPKQYKSNRDNLLRPIDLPKVIDYIKEVHAGIVAEGCEADDLQSHYAYRGLKEGRVTVQVSIDKDAKQCEGWLFNPDKDEAPRLIKGLGELFKNENGDVDGYGRKFLYYQMLFGDPVDGYKPTSLAINAKGKKVLYGEVSAYSDLVELKTDQECIQKIADKYREWYPNPVTYRVHGNGEEVTKDWKEMWQMYTDCAFMQRFPNDRLIVTELMDKLGVKYESISSEV